MASPFLDDEELVTHVSLSNHHVPILKLSGNHNLRTARSAVLLVAVMMLIRFDQVVIASKEEMLA